MQVPVATHPLRPLEYWASLDRQSRVLGVSIAVSVLLHAVALTVHFRFPDALKLQNANQTLDVILVNARTKQKPVKAQALAQANLDRGGDTDQERRASTPLPVTQSQGGNDLAQAQRRVQELEAKQRELLSQSRDSRNSVTPTPSQATPSPEPSSTMSGRDLADLSLRAMKLQAELNRRIEEYNKRPRKQFIGASAMEYRFAHYEDEWRQKVERVGTLNYPPEARGKLYGNLRLTVTIRPDGTLESVELDRPSGLKVLDEAAIKIVRLAAPYAAFPSDIRKDTDLLVITSTWFFEQGDVLKAK